MAIILEPKGITIESNPTSDTSDVLPLGQKPEGELNSLVRMQNAFNKLMSTVKLLDENIKKLTEENKRLKDALGITEVQEPMNAEAAHGLILTKDMEIKDGHK
jgi:hypothetical protein